MISTKDWLSSLKEGDRVKIGHQRMPDKDFVFTTIKESLKDKVAIHTACGMVRWFSRSTGLEVGKSMNLAGVIKPPGS